MKSLLRICLCFLIISVNAPALATTFKIATLSPEGSFWMETMREAADTVSKKTGERVKFRFYPGGVMGNDAAVLRKIRIGQLQGAAFSGGALAQRSPDTQIYNLPLLFNSYDEVDYVRRKMDSVIEKDFAKKGFVTFGLAEGGFAYIMSKQRISSTEDLAKNKVWAPADDPAAQSAAETFGFTPTPLAIGDVLTGLQTDLINTVTTSPVAAIALQWHTQISYITDLPLAYFYALMVVDKRAFNRLDKADQAIVDTAMRDAFAKIDKQNRKDNASAKEALQKQGVTIVTPTKAELKEWHEKTRMASRLFVEKAGISQDILHQVQNLLDEYRSKQAHAE